LPWGWFEHLTLAQLAKSFSRSGTSQAGGGQ
jgi:hypothetical protein